VKTYRSTRSLLAEIEQVLDSKPMLTGQSPLDKVVALLCQGRHYAWAGIYLAAEKTAASQLLGPKKEPHPGEVALPETRSKIVLSMKLAGREHGVLAVESDDEAAFGTEDRVLLEQVATLLARFITGPGKYLARKARTRSESENASALRLSSAAAKR
jgi:putative methionine-R-sulfoxide reductase with GAF domain